MAPQQAKYSYKFVLQAKRPVEDREDQLSRIEIQYFIDEILGMYKQKSSHDSRTQA